MVLMLAPKSNCAPAAVKKPPRMPESSALLIWPDFSLAGLSLSATSLGAMALRGSSTMAESSGMSMTASVSAAVEATSMAGASSPVPRMSSVTIAASRSAGVSILSALDRKQAWPARFKLAQSADAACRLKPANRAR